MSNTKRDIVNEIALDTGLTQIEVKSVVDKFIDKVVNIMLSGEKVELRNFGVFSAKLRKARIGRNPNKPDATVNIPSRHVPHFKAGHPLKARFAKMK